MNILGISAFYHDSAACLLQDGRLVAAGQEERFTRRKHDASFPEHAIRSCLSQASLGVEDIDAVAFYEKPLVKLERALETFYAVAPRGAMVFTRTIPAWFKERLVLPGILRKRIGYQGEVIYAAHHEAHAASAFFPSPFERAAILTVVEAASPHSLDNPFLLVAMTAAEPLLLSHTRRC